MPILLPKIIAKTLVVILLSAATGFAAGWMVAFGPPTEDRGLSLPEVYFSPKGGCEEAIIREIDAAKLSILVQAYSFTSDPIEQALVRAHVRGVKVTVVVDDAQVNALGSAIVPLKTAGIDVYLDKSHAIFHSKVMIIDEHTLITGSYNFSRNAEYSNVENLIVFRSPGTVRKYMENWLLHLSHSEKFLP